MPFDEVGDEYLHVLFPQRGNEREAEVATAICTGLAEARRSIAGPTAGPGPVPLSFGPELGLESASVFVCRRCRWVSWRSDEHHVCLGERERQEPDVSPGVGPMVVDLGASTRYRSEPSASDWWDYHEALYPPAVVRSWVRFMRSTSGARMAQRLWRRRQELGVLAREGGLALADQHVGVVLETDDSSVRVGCLSCPWLLSITTDDPLVAGADLAEQHGAW